MPNQQTWKDPSPESWAEQLLAHIRVHVSTELDALEEYQAIARESPDEHVRYVIELIMEDEERHHRLFDQFANALELSVTGLELTPRTPPWGGVHGKERLLAVTHRLLNLERDDIQMLEALKVQLETVAHHTLWGLLITIMEMDTRKHIAMLQSLERLVEDSVDLETET